MNKRGLIKYIVILITLVISIYFLANSRIVQGILPVPILIGLLFAVTIFMFDEMKKIKKNKFIYDVTLLLLMIFSVAIFLYIICVVMSCFLDSTCSMELSSIFILIYPTFLLTLVLFGIADIFKETNKVNDILIISISLLAIGIHLRYYLESNFLHNFLPDDGYYVYSYDYVTQNYIYFSIMYFLALLHYRVNKY